MSDDSYNPTSNAAVQNIDDDDDDDYHGSANVAHANNYIVNSLRRSPAVDARRAAVTNVSKAALKAKQAEYMDSAALMNRSKWKKKVATYAAAGVAGGTGLTSAVNMASGGAILGGATTVGSTAGWAALGGGAALGAGPIGLMAAGTALTIGGSARQGVAMYKTHKHILALEEILNWARGGYYPCEHAGSPVHDNIVEVVLPYLINKKKLKRWRKGVRTLPSVLGLPEQVRSFAQSIRKRRNETRGVARGIHAHNLAQHHCLTNCTLTVAIIAELFSIDQEEAEEARWAPIDVLGKMLADKFKSV